MAQMRKLACDGIRTNSRGDPQAPLVSARQEILTSLVSALDSVCMAMSKLNAEVACVTVHEDSVIAVGTDKGRVFLNSRREIQTDFYKFCRGPCLQNLTTANAHTKDQEGDLSKPSKDGEHGKPRAPSDAQSNIFVLRKMVEEVFTVLYSEAVGKSSLVPVPYEWIQKDPSCVVAHGLPEGVTLKKPSEYDTKTLMKILEQSHRIQFTVKRPAEDLSREAKSSTDVNHNSSTTVITPSSHGPGKTTAQVVTSSSPATSSNSVLSNFLYGMPMSSKPHPDGKLDFKPMSLLNLGKDRLANWTVGTDKISTSVKDCANNDETTRLPGEQGQSPPGIHISKRLLFSIVHEKSEKWDSFIRETEDINTLRECVQILFNSRYAEALGLDHMVPVPYRKIACDPGAVEIIGIPDQIPFKRPCTYGVPKLKRILDERHGIRFIVKRMFDERIFTAAGKIAREEGKHDLGSMPEDSFLDNLSIPPTTAELVSNPHSSRSASACVSPLADCEAGPSGDCIPLKRIKTEPPDGEIIQVTVPDAGTSGEEASESVAEPVAAAAAAAACPATASPSAPSVPPAPSAPHHQMENHAAEALSPSAASQSIRRSSEAGSLVEDIGEMILQLRRQVESIFSIKYAEALGLPEPAKVPYSKFQMYPEDLCVTGLPEGISLRRPNCFGAAKLRKILAASSQIQFVIKRPELLTEQVKQELPSMPICDSGEALGLDRSVVVPYKLIRGSPESVEVSGLPDDIPFRNPNTYDIVCLEKILQAADKITFNIKSQLQPFAEICSQACNTGTDASTNRRKRKRVQESNRVPASSDLGISTNQIPVMQWPMYMVDYSGVNVQVPGKVNY
uniref:general transcription factor II-I repeat domain-containing protein 1 n=1 Tax=Epinephelus lanceolatus TaxID=310571 RepID=UPI001445BFE4|nr:general transcription factor II-I repeat domain-containing protein 1 [Epinephelus lanceolatus]